MKIAGLVLAAGGGSRLGRPKAEVTVHGRRLDALKDDLSIDATVITLVDTPSVGAQHLRRPHSGCTTPPPKGTETTPSRVAFTRMPASGNGLPVGKAASTAPTRSGPTPGLFAAADVIVAKVRQVLAGGPP
jgi:hypothetical protein